MDNPSNTALGTDSEVGMSTSPGIGSLPPGITSGQSTPSVSSNPFNLENLRKSQQFDQGPDSEMQILSVAVEKPSKQEFHRSIKDWHTKIPVFSPVSSSDLYLVTPEIQKHFPNHIQTKGLAGLVNRDGRIILWPHPLPSGSGGMMDAWGYSALKAIEIGLDKWVQIIASKTSSGYGVNVAQGDLEDPKWPSISFQEAIDLAVKSFGITTMDHPIIRQLQGKI